MNCVDRRVRWKHLIFFFSFFKVDNAVSTFTSTAISIEIEMKGRQGVKYQLDVHIHPFLPSSLSLLPTTSTPDPFHVSNCLRLLISIGDKENRISLAWRKVSVIWLPQRRRSRRGEQTRQRRLNCHTDVDRARTTPITVVSASNREKLCRPKANQQVYATATGYAEIGLVWTVDCNFLQQAWHRRDVYRSDQTIS